MTLQIGEQKDSDITILTLAGRLDAITSPDFEHKLDQLMAGGCKGLVIDFERLELIVSAGLRVFLAFAKKCKRSGGRMALCRMKPAVHDVFQIAGFTEILAIFPTREDAVRSILPGPS